MAQEKIQIQVSETGTVSVVKNFEKLAHLADKASVSITKSMQNAAKSADKTKSSVINLSAALKTLSFSAVAYQVANAVDGYTNFQNRLKTVTQGTHGLKQATKELFDISNQTYQAFKTTGEIFTRTSSALQQMGIEQSKVLDFTRSLNQAVALSGATSIEASNALIQLSQGMGSGVLRGDELRSVMEQLPKVADVIAKEMGVTRGQLFALGKEGKVSAETVLNAFVNAKDKLSKEFSELTPTLGNSMTVLANNLVQGLGEVDTALGISGAIAKGIIALSGSITVLIKALTALSAAFAVNRLLTYGSAWLAMASAVTTTTETITVAAAVTATASQKIAAAALGIPIHTFLGVSESALKASTAIKTLEVAAGNPFTAALSKARAAIVALNVAILANPYVALATAIVAIVGLLYLFNDSITFGASGVADLGDICSVVWDEIKAGFSFLTESIFAGWNNVIGLFSGFGSFVAETFPGLFTVVDSFFKGITFSADGAIRLILRFFDHMIKSVSAVFVFVSSIWGRLPDIFRIIAEKVSYFFTTGFKNMVESAVSIFKEIPDKMYTIGVNSKNSFLRGFKGMVTTSASWLNDLLSKTASSLGTTAQRIVLGGSGAGALNVPKNQAVSAASSVKATKTKTPLTMSGIINEATTAAGKEMFKKGVLESAFDRLIAKAEKQKKLLQENTQEAKSLMAVSDKTDGKKDKVEKPKKEKAAKDKEQLTTFIQLLEKYQQENDLLRLNADARAIALEKIAVEEELKRSLSAVEDKLLTTVLEEKKLLEDRAAALEAIKQPLKEYIDQQTALNTLLKEKVISQREFNEASAVEEEKYLSAQTPVTFDEGFTKKFRQMQLESRNAFASIGEDVAAIFGPGGTLSQGIGDAVAKSIVFGESFKESIAGVAKSIMTTLISSLVQIGINMLINATLGQAIIASTTAASVGAATITASAWAPAAAMVSLASFGANAAPASAGIVTTTAVSSTLAAVPGFELGGYTGNKGKKSISGVVHGQEFVMNAQATAKNRNLLEALNNGKTPAVNSNIIPAVPGNSNNAKINVTINNNAPNTEFEVRQLTPNDVEIIAKRVVAKDAPKVVANNLNNPNSIMSKGISNNIKTERKRG